MDVAATWAMIGGMGVYQGCNPPMGWLPALESGFFSGRVDSLVCRVAATSLGHLLAMMVVLVPLAILLGLGLVNPQPLQRTFSMLLAGLGLYKLWRPHHPLFIARIPPGRPIKWSFLMAFTHCGSPLMMATSLITLIMFLPSNITASIAPDERVLIDVGMATVVPTAMILPLLVTSCLVALVLYRRRDLKAVTRLWFNFDIGWATSMIVMGLMGLWMSSMMMGS